MKLRGFLLLVTATVLFSSLAAFWVLTGHSIDSAFYRIDQHSKQNIVRAVETLIETKKSYLSSLANMLRYNYDFIGLSIVARETNDRALTLEEMARMATSSRIDTFELVSPQKDLEFSFGTKVRHFPSGLFDPKSIRTGIVNSSKGPMVVAVSPLDLYDEVTGFALIGIELSKVRTEIEGVYETSLTFTTESHSTSAIPLELALSFDPGLKLTILPGASPEQSVLGSLRGELLISVIAAFFLALIATYVLLEFAFVRKFESLTSGIESGRKILENNGTPAPQPVTTFISEVQEVSKSFMGFTEAIRNYRERLEQEANRAAENSKRAALAELAQQVAHDIRSPIASIDMILLAIEGIPSQKRTLIRACLSRINNIAEKLLSRFRNEPESGDMISEAQIFVLVDQVIQEKAHKHPTQIIEVEADEMTRLRSFARVQSGEFKTAISNLLENAIEASPSESKVVVHISCDPENIYLSIRDRGPGIPAERMAQIGKRGVTFGKVGGSGLGVSHARESIESWGGTFKITSSTEPESSGTTVELVLARIAVPSWAATEVPLVNYENVAIIDDDPSIHDAWRSRLQSNPNLKVFSFMHTREAELWAREHNERVFYLCDQEIDDYLSGLELLEKLETKGNAILVSAVEANDEIRQRCQALNISFLSKSQLSFVPIQN